jgi:Zn-dependent protease
MTDTIRLGRVAGVKVGLHWSLLVMVALVATGLAKSRFVVDAPGYSNLAYEIAGVLTALGLLLGVLLHELGHAVVARRRHLTVDGITLSWMGGVTRIEGDSPSPTTELLVSGVGPLASAALGGALWLARSALIGTSGAHAGGDALAVAALGWLAWINIVLAIFNILPASPLDGGRVLHAVIWIMGRDRWKATQIAAWAGMILGAGIVLAGFVATERSQSVLDGFVVGFVGWWLLVSARAELSEGSARRALEGVRIADVMRPVGEAPGWITVRSFVEAYGAARPGWVWLLRDWNGGYGGVLLGDLLAGVPYPQWDVARPIDFAMPIASAIGSTPDEDALSVAGRMGDAKVVLVVADGHTQGAVLLRDLESLMRSGGQRLAFGRHVAGQARS